jgi:hypothetical protein
MKSPEDFDDEIVEMSYALDGWIPVSHRLDKIYPNKYITGLTNDSLIYANSCIADGCGVSKSCYIDKSSLLIDAGGGKHSCYTSMSELSIEVSDRKQSCGVSKSELSTELLEYLIQFSIEKVLNIYSIKSIFLNFDERLNTGLILYNICTPNVIYCIHTKKKALVEIVEQFEHKKNISRIFFQNSSRRSLIDVNIINSKICDHTYILDELNSCYYFVENSVGVMFLENKIDHLNSFEKIVNFKNMCNKVLLANGIIIITYFNTSDNYSENDFFECESSNDYLEQKNLILDKADENILEFRSRTKFITMFRCDLSSRASVYNLIRYENFFVMFGSSYNFYDIQHIRSFLCEDRHKISVRVELVKNILNYTVLHELIPFETKTVKDYLKKNQKYLTLKNTNDFSLVSQFSVLVLRK